jgi:hypothetical protein
MTNSTPEGRMALRNSDFNSYMGDSAGAYPIDYAALKDAAIARGDKISPALNQGYQDRQPNWFQQKYNDLFGTNYGTGRITVDQAAFEAANPNAVLDANGNWSGLSTTNNGEWSGSLGASSGLTGSSLAQGAQALAGLGQAYVGYKNYGLAKDMFNFQKDATNRNIANQASEYNTGIQNAGDVGMSLAGATMDANARAAYQAKLDSRKISTAPVG